MSFKRNCYGLVILPFISVCYCYADVEGGNADSRTVIEKAGVTNFYDAAISALAKSNGFAKHKSDYRTAQKKQFQSHLSFLPSIHIEVNKSNSNTDYTQYRQSYPNAMNRKDKNTQIQGVLSQNIFHGFYTFNNNRAMSANTVAAKWKLENEKQTLLYNVLDAVCRLWYTKERFKYAKMKEENLEKALRAERDKFKAGISTKYDVSKAEADYAEAVYMADEAKFQLLSAKAVYKKIASMEPLSEVELPDFKIDIPENVAKLKVIAFKANPAVLEAMYAKEAADKYCNAVIGKLGPRCDLKATVGRNLQSNNQSIANLINPGEKATDNRNTKSISLSLTIPIFENSESGNTFSEISLAREAAAKAAFEVKDQQSTLERDCVMSFEQYKTALSLIESAKSAVHSAEIGVEGDHQESDLGLKSLTETLVREKQLCDLRTSLAEAKYRLVLAKGQIMKAMGRLSLQDLYKKNNQFKKRRK